MRFFFYNFHLVSSKIGPLSQWTGSPLNFTGSPFELVCHPTTKGPIEDQWFRVCLYPFPLDCNLQSKTRVDIRLQFSFEKVHMGTDQNPKSAQNESVAPATALAYLDPKYWDERFSKEEHYEWFKDYSHFRHLILPLLKPDSSVLELGSGNSKLSEELYNDGITDITCIDLSAVAVEKMERRLHLKGMKEIKVIEADMLDMPFGDECFDVVVEKGTMDVLFVDGGDPWNPQPSTRVKVMAMLEGVHRVLKKDGIFVSITFGQPHFRRPLFNAPEFTWSFECSTFGDGFHYFFYTLRKGRRLFGDKGEGERFDTPSICLLQDELEGEDYMFRTNVDELNC